jgi:hypothetical protein
MLYTPDYTFLFYYEVVLYERNIIYIKKEVQYTCKNAHKNNFTTKI